jgi:hypothetical protein
VLRAEVAAALMPLLETGEQPITAHRMQGRHKHKCAKHF